MRGAAYCSMEYFCCGRVPRLRARVRPDTYAGQGGRLMAAIDAQCAMRGQRRFGAPGLRNGRPTGVQSEEAAEELGRHRSVARLEVVRIGRISWFASVVVPCSGPIKQVWFTRP